MNIGREMALPMETIIGGPLQALVKAQTMAASETASFIQSVGLTGEGNDRKAQTVDFSFDRKVTGDPGTAPSTETVNMQVPLLTIVPVPFIRIEEAAIDFECNVSSSSVQSRDTTAEGQASASYSGWGAKVAVKASYSQQKTSKSEVSKSASLKVHVKAVQEEVPGGLAKVLQILETAVTDNPSTGTPAP